jgi:FG-GAP-like repeat/FG-GAP repeat
MGFTSWLQNARSASPSGFAKRNRGRSLYSRAPARSRPRPELLEDRTLLSSLSFSVPAQYSVAQGAESVAVADFNGDHKSDLVVATNGASTVSVLRGNGDGTFGAAQNFGAGGVPESVVVGDLNGDGQTDLVVTATSTLSVAVLLGNGDGTFQTAKVYAVGSDPEQLALGDFNGDGKTDVVVGNILNEQNDVSVLLGNGDGTLQAAQNFPVGNAVESLAVGDFNADGKSDVIVSIGSTVSELLGNGDGTFQTERNIGSALPDSALGVTVGDLNGDGKPDVAVANPIGKSVSVLLNNGDGTFQTAQDYGVGSSPVAVAIGDFDGDGKPDLATASNVAPGSVSVVLGNGDGTFQAAQNFAGGSSPGSLAAGDFNGDGRLDLAVTNQGTTVSVLLNAIELAAAAVTLSSIAGAPSSNPVATFTNAYPSVSGVSYSATIDWGDGSVSPGTVTGSGILTVSGSHTYADPGQDAITVVIAGNSRFPATATVHSTATVVALGQSVQNGLTGNIGFWHSKNGQTLINGFNGGSSSTALSSWLAATFPNLYGAGAGANNLNGQTNTLVAAFYKTQFALPGSNVEAQVLATALNVYATTLSLGGTSGQAYGFTVSANGLGADSFNVGADGAAFGVAKKTTRNVLELLKAVDHQTVLGVLYDGDPTLQKLANHLFHVLNEAGTIS